MKRTPTKQCKFHQLYGQVFNLLTKLIFLTIECTRQSLLTLFRSALASPYPPLQTAYCSHQRNSTKAASQQCNSRLWPWCSRWQVLSTQTVLALYYLQILIRPRHSSRILCRRRCQLIRHQVIHTAQVTASLARDNLLCSSSKLRRELCSETRIWKIAALWNWIIRIIFQRKVVGALEVFRWILQWPL